MSKSIVSQISKNLIFKYRIKCRQYDQPWSSKLELDEDYHLPCFGEFDQQKPFADLRIAWSSEGLLLTCHVAGKKKSTWCRSTQLLESDGLQLWVDTRNTGNVHRATKFCHWFVVLPFSGAAKKDRPVASMLKINRAKEDSPALNRQPLKLHSQLAPDGYLIKALIPAACLHGWNPEEQQQLGFAYAVVDRELGWQTLAVGPEMPISEDPSLWQTMELVG